VKIITNQISKILALKLNSIPNDLWQQKRKTQKLPNEPIFSNPGRFDPGLIPGWDCLYRDSTNPPVPPFA
jgi:hypothetical protein